MLSKRKSAAKFTFFKAQIDDQSILFSWKSLLFSLARSFKNIDVRAENYAHTKTFKPDLVLNSICISLYIHLSTLWESFPVSFIYII